MLEEANNDFRVENVMRWDKYKIMENINSFNSAARSHIYFVLTDQDTNDRCPPNAINELAEPLHPNLLYRFSVMEVESWVLAHREAISRFLSIPLNKIPHKTDDIVKPKECLVNMARSSKSSNIRKDIVPRNNSTSKVGPDYNGRLIKFVLCHWDVRIASQVSPSLERTFERLTNFTATRPV